MILLEPHCFTLLQPQRPEIRRAEAKQRLGPRFPPLCEISNGPQTVRIFEWHRSFHPPSVGRTPKTCNLEHRPIRWPKKNMKSSMETPWFFRHCIFGVPCGTIFSNKRKESLLMSVAEHPCWGNQFLEQNHLLSGTSWGFWKKQNDMVQN